jgi:fermentation-respiration switch protein FrsA (DUF1100 family)
MRRSLALLCHSSIFLAAWQQSHSTSGFLLNGPGLCLLVDRFLLRLLPWPASLPWGRDLAGGGVAFLLGTVAFYFARPGIVPWWEAAYRGLMVCIAVFLIKTVARLIPPQRWVWRLGLRGLGIGLIVGLVPIVAALHPLHTVPKRTPAALGLAFEDVRFRTDDGLLLAGWVVPHPSARGNVIFCHGHGRNRGHVAGLLPTLHGLGLNVLAFDFRGHGDSEGHTSTFGQREVRDLVAAWRYLRGRFPDKPLFLVGVSLGAAVSLQALPHLEGVRGVWSEGSFSRLDTVVENTFGVLPAPVRKPLVRLYHGLGWLDCALWVPAINPMEVVRRQSVPICFCHGRQDELVPLAEGEALYSSYRGPKRCWWAEATHYNVRQRNQQEYRARLRLFVEECVRSGDPLGLVGGDTMARRHNETRAPSVSFFAHGKNAR